MNLLGSVGQLYMFVLLILLFLGSGFALWRFINFLMERGTLKQGAGEAIKQNAQTKPIIKNNNEEVKVKGGFIMANNGWIKLAVFSFVGIIVSVAILGLVSTKNPQGMSANGMNGNMNVQGGMNVNTPMGNMQMQGNMNGGMAQNNNSVQQQINQIQQQLNQIQQQLNGGMSGNAQMQQGGSSNMQQSGGMGMMGGMMGGMSSMPQNNSNMNNMPQNNSNMNNTQQNSGSSSSSMSSMPMM